jgi:peptidoglycan hydrolase CwlO-like protein
MISLEQVKLLETKVTRVIDHLKKVTEENSRLKEKLDSCQKRVDELEVLVQAFKDDQSRIEDGILAALNQLNQVEDAIGSAAVSEGAAETVPAPSARKKAEPAKPAPDPEEAKEEAGDSGQDGGELDIF